MATNYPGSLDDFTNPSAGDATSSPSHAAQHANANDAIEAIQATLGTNPQGGESTVKDRVAAVESDISDIEGDIITVNERVDEVEKGSHLYEYIAGQNLVAGQLVSVNEQGKLVGFSGWGPRVSSAPATINFATNNESYCFIPVPSSNKFIIGYRDADNNNYVTAICGEYDNGVFSWGTPVVVDSNAGREIIGGWHSASSTFVIGSVRSSSNGTMQLRAASVTNLDLNFGTLTSFTPPNASRFISPKQPMVYEPNQNRLVFWFAYYDSIGGAYYQRAASINVSTLTISVTQSSNLGGYSGGSSTVHAIWDSTENCFCLVHGGTVSAATMSGGNASNLSYTAKNNLPNGSSGYENFIAFDGTYPVAIYSAGSGLVMSKACVITYDEGVPEGNTDATLSGSTTTSNGRGFISYDPTIGKFLVTAIGVPTGGSSGGIFVWLTRSGTSVAWGTPAKQVSGPSVNDGVIHIYLDGKTVAQGHKLIGPVQEEFYGSLESFIGIVQEDANENDLVPVTVAGGISRVHSDLVPSSNYYYDEGGSIVTIPGFFLGRSITSTDLILSGPLE